MCCRYYFDSETIRDMERLAHAVSGFLNMAKSGDIHPADRAFILKCGKEEALIAEPMRWGFISHDDKLLINARAESAMEKAAFADAARLRRCIVPAKYFYEWDKNKVKYTFSREDVSSLYMAGFYDLFGNEDRFTIVTTAANASMEPVHDRMPLILEEKDIKDWIIDDTAVKDFLSAGSPLLTRFTDYEQMSLFNL